MGFRFRKSVKAGPFRMTFSKSGVGYSVGGKGFRMTKKASGGIRTTASVPGTGISYVTDHKSDRKKAVASRNISAAELQYAQSKMNQLQESVHLVNTTTSPEVFFKRLHMSIDILLDLQTYEKYGIFKGSKPSDDYNKIIRNMEATVNDFVDRALEANNKKIASLKTDAAKERNHDKFVVSLIAAFDCANTFWSGNYSKTRVIPHYSGSLFTANNYRRVQALFYAAGDRSLFCTNCGNKLGDGANFCTRCGAPRRPSALANDVIKTP